MVLKMEARPPSEKNKGRKENKMTYVVQREMNHVLSHYFRSPRGVYEYLSDYYSHDTAANAEGWCELASVGEVYEGSEFNGKFEESFTISVKE